MSGVQNGLENLHHRPTPPARTAVRTGSHNNVANGSSSAVSPEMLTKISKKIAQLTKVIYSLNTKNDDLEFDLEQVGFNVACIFFTATFAQIRASYEETLRRSKSHPSLAAGVNGQSKEATPNGDDDEETIATESLGGGGKKRRSKTPEAGESDTRRELRKARHIMKKLQVWQETIM